MIKRSMIIWAFCFACIQAYSQCCSPGNPVGGTSALGTNEETVLSIFVNYKYGYAGSYFEGDQPTATQFIQNGNYNYLGLAAAYGLSKKLSIEVESGFFLNKTQNYVAGIRPSRMVGTGLTDLAMQIKYNLYRDVVRDIEISPGIGMKLPLGSYTQMYQGALLTRDLQPTTGSSDFILSLFMYKGYMASGLRLFLLNRIELKGKNPDRYQYGNLFATSLFGSFSLSPRWLFIAQFRSEIREMDTRPATGTGIPTKDGREKIFPSGSQKVFAIPQLTYLTHNGGTFSLLVDIPMYQYYNNKQLASTVAFTLGFSKKLRSRSQKEGMNRF